MAERIIQVGAIQQRRDTDANWTSKNPVLLDGEQITVVLSDNKIKHKTGYGGKRYNELPFDDFESCLPSNSISTTLSASAWENSQQIIPISGLKANQNGYISLSQTTTKEQYNAAAAAEVVVTSQIEGSITVSCFGEIPQIDIPIVITLLG